MVGPTASLSTLSRSDGSASYKCPFTGCDVLGAVNAPIELPARRDALKPEEATVEVFVKPGNTTAGVGERYVEGILRSVLGKVILGRERGFPRRGVVITLAIVGGETVDRGDSVRLLRFFLTGEPRSIPFNPAFKLTLPAVPHPSSGPPSHLAPGPDFGRRSSVDDHFSYPGGCHQVWRNHHRPLGCRCKGYQFTPRARIFLKEPPAPE